MADYALGNLDAEHERLQRQGARLSADTERLFREAGIGTGQRILELGSGTGEVSMVLSRLVGPTGEVVAIERDTQTIARARDRVSAAGATSIRFIESDISRFDEAGPFDAVVGRFILCWTPNPASVLHRMATLIQPGGVMAFQEPWQAPVLALLRPLPLWHSAASLLYRSLPQAGGRPDMGADLCRLFEEAGLANPTARQEIKLGRDASYANSIVDTLRTLWPSFSQADLADAGLGELETLTDRMIAEAGRLHGLGVASPAPLSIWARK